MIYEAKIKDAKKEFSLPDNKKYIDVSFDILLDGKFVDKRRLSFPIGTSKETIVEAVNKNCQMFSDDQVRAKEVEAIKEAEAETDNTIEELKGLNDDKIKSKKK